MAVTSALIALILFAIAAFGVKFGSVNIVDLGLAFLALAVVLGYLPDPFHRG